MNPLKPALAAREAELSTKRKEAKEKFNSQLPIGQLNNRTIEGTEQSTVSQSEHNPNTIDQTLPASDRSAKARKNQEIDEYLEELVRRGLIPEAFIPWHAKCIHTLGLQKHNEIVIASLEADAPPRLIAYKLKGAMQLFAKRQFYAES
jgi:hypothetical protein